MRTISHDPFAQAHMFLDSLSLLRAATVAAFAVAAAGCGAPSSANAEIPAGGISSAGSATPGAHDTPTADSKRARGEYLVAIGGCHDCHTPGSMEPNAKVEKSDLLVGSPLGFMGPWGTSYAANLRLKLAEVGEREWIAMVRKRSSLPPMPWPILHSMTEDDLSALYSYVVSLGPSGEHAPTALAPGVTPRTPYLNFEPVLPKGASEQ